MAQIKIRLIDSDNIRRRKIHEEIRPFNEFPEEEASFQDIWDPDDETQIRNEAESEPGLFLLHINDQEDESDSGTAEPFDEYLKHINKDLHNALIVLYSGGGIDVKEQTANHITVTQAGKEWDFDVTNGEQFCIIRCSINSASELKIVPALEKYTADGTKEEFFNILLGVEDSLEYLPALAILCQGYLAVHANPDTGEPDLTVNDQAYAVCVRALEAMGWGAFVTGEGTGKELLSPNLKDPEARQKLQNQVCDASWWQVFDSEDLMKQAGEEWGGNQSKGWAEVEELLKRIVEPQHIPPKCVAKAYCAIAERLRGSDSQ